MRKGLLVRSCSFTIDPVIILAGFVIGGNNRKTTSKKYGDVCRCVLIFHLLFVRYDFLGKRLHKFVALPSRQELKVFLNFAGPIAFALLGKVRTTAHRVVC